jgi:hypothetical protein
MFVIYVSLYSINFTRLLFLIYLAILRKSKSFIKFQILLFKSAGFKAKFLLKSIYFGNFLKIKDFHIHLKINSTTNLAWKVLII